MVMRKTALSALSLIVLLSTEGGQFVSSDPYQIYYTYSLPSIPNTLLRSHQPLLFPPGFFPVSFGGVPIALPLDPPAENTEEKNEGSLFRLYNPAEEIFNGPDEGYSKYDYYYPYPFFYPKRPEDAVKEE